MEGAGDIQGLINGFASSTEFQARNWSSEMVQELVRGMALAMPAGGKAYDRLKVMALVLANACAFVYLATTLLPLIR